MLEAILALIAGLLIGSFLNVCIYRMPRDLSIVRPPRSFCPECEHMIAWHDNIPVLSYLILRGRCRYCGKPISARYPVVEILTGLLFFGIVLGHGASMLAIKECAFAALIVGLIFSDLEERILPDELTLGGMALGILFAALVPSDEGLLALFLPQWGPVWLSIIQAVFGAVVSSALLWLVGVLYLRLRKREGLGFGDVKMVAMIGAFLGLQGALMTVIVGSVIGSVLGLGYILVTRKDASTYELPFGTFLGAAALFAGLFREQFFAWIQKIGG